MVGPGTIVIRGIRSRSIERIRIEREDELSSPQSKERFDGLYDYDFGTVRDAAKHLGIGNVDEKKEVRQILKYIQEGRGRKEESNSSGETQQPAEPLLPRGERVPRFNEPLAQAPGMSNPSGGGGGGRTDANMSAIRGGDDLNEWYQTKFVPHLKLTPTLLTVRLGMTAATF